MQIKNHLLFGALLLLLSVTACKPKDFVEATGDGPTIRIGSEFEKIQGINVGDKVTIPVIVTSEKGIKRLAYFFINETKNGTESGTPVYFDSESFPRELNQDIEFTIVPQMTELVLVSFDKENRSTELHIPMSEIRKLPVLTFKDNIKYRETAFFEKHMHVRGNITSEFDLKTITYQMIVDGNVSAESNVNFTDKKDTPFDIDIIVPRGLQAVVVTATNIYNGFARDTFKIGGVADDAINLSLTGGITSIDMIYADSINNISGSIQSGSDVTSLSYAVKINGMYGTETPIELGEPLNNFSFNIPLVGAPGMEAVRISGLNEGGMEQQVELTIAKVTQKLLYFKDVVLTSDIGDNKFNWFAAWKAPHRFTAAQAAPNAPHINIGLIRHTTGFRIVTPSLYNVAGYDVSMPPYLQGFNVATYTLITAFRRSVTAAAMDTILYDNNLENFMNRNIKGPGPVGENYNITTSYRRLSDNIVATSANRGFVIGWGSRSGESVNHETYGLVLIKSVSISGTVCTLTLDIKVPMQDMQTKYNPVSQMLYP